MQALLHFTLRHARWFNGLLMLFWAVMIAGVFARWWRPHGNWMFLLFLTVVTAVLFGGWTRWQRDRLIRETPLPQFLKRKLRETYPHLDQKDADLVERGLRQFFMATNRSTGRFVAMPSRVVDAMWHEFILHTRAYRDWCNLALGRFLHHVPAEALGADAKHNDGLRRAWFWSCKDEAIDPRNPTRLPLLFALDAKLGIAGGYRYVPDCKIAGVAVAAGVTYCATEFGSGDASGDADGFGGSDGGDGGGDGGCGGGGD